MTREEAARELLKLVQTYGTLWNKHIPQPAWDRMTRVAEVLTPEERRKTLQQVDFP